MRSNQKFVFINFLSLIIILLSSGLLFSQTTGKILGNVVDGNTGICTDCAEEHFNLESACAHCGGIIGDT